MHKYYNSSTAIRHRSAAVLIAALAIFAGGTSLSAAGALPVNDVFSTTSADSSVTSSGSAASASIRQSTAGTAFIQVAAGTYYSVGLRVDGSVWTWGRNLLGELGLPDAAVASISAPVRLNALTDIVSIATSGSGYQLAVKQDGTVWEWGKKSDSSTETQPPRQIPALTDVSQVSAMGSVNYALKRDGTVWAWTRNQETYEPGTPVRVQGLAKITSINVADNKVYALDSAGVLWIFSNKFEDNKLKLSPPARLAGIPAFKQIAIASNGQMYGIDAAGTAWKCTLDMSSSVLKLSAKPSKIFPELKIKQIQAADGYAVLLTTRGDVWTYGKKPAGKEGKVNGLRGINSIAAGEYHSLAIDSTGQVWGWGGNKWYEVGVPQNKTDGMVYLPEKVRTPVTVKVNGNLLVSSFPAIMDKNLVSIPVKDIAKALDADLVVTSSAYGSTYCLKYKQVTVAFKSSQTEAEMNGRSITLPMPVYTENGATMIPASLLKEMGFDVKWDSTRSELNIQSR
ncbi:stalk domain-containing protein [Paenibacillus azoreducens]|uniref:stalk domain-containing protein n=1 Tax=Paenibacillus azoreducens TaxID=116718 RepID=UPI0039F648CF